MKAKQRRTSRATIRSAPTLRAQDEIEFARMQRLARAHVYTLAIVAVIMGLPLIGCRLARFTPVFFSNYESLLGFNCAVRATLVLKSVLHRKQLLELPEYHKEFYIFSVVFDAITVGGSVWATLYLLYFDNQFARLATALAPLSASAAHTVGTVIQWAISGFIGNLAYEFFKRKTGLFKKTPKRKG